MFFFVHSYNIGKIIVFFWDGMLQWHYLKVLLDIMRVYGIVWRFYRTCWRFFFWILWRSYAILWMLSGMFAFLKMCRGTFMGCLLFLGTCMGLGCLSDFCGIVYWKSMGFGRTLHRSQKLAASHIWGEEPSIKEPTQGTKGTRVLTHDHLGRAFHGCFKRWSHSKC